MAKPNLHCPTEDHERIKATPMLWDYITKRNGVVDYDVVVLDMRTCLCCGGTMVVEVS